MKKQGIYPWNTTIKAIPPYEKFIEYIFRKINFQKPLDPAKIKFKNTKLKLFQNIVLT